MKTTPANPLLFSRAARSWAIASSAVCLGLTLASAQTPNTTPSASDRTPSEPPATYNSPSTASTDTTASLDKNGTLKRSDRRFLTKVAEGNEKEVAIAQLAAQRASSGEVRTYAQRLVSDHEKMKGDIAQLAQQKGIALESGKSLHHSGLGNAETDTSVSRANGAAGTPASPGLASSTATSDTMASEEATSDRHYRSLAKKTGRDFDKEFVEMMVDDHKKDVKMFEKEAKDADDSDVRAFAASHLATLQAHLEQANSLSKSAAE